jgi:hypothetical protein
MKLRSSSNIFSKISSPYTFHKRRVLLKEQYLLRADPSGREVQGEGLRPFPCWDCEFDSRRRHEFLSLLSVVCSQVKGLCDGSIPHPEKSCDCTVSFCVIQKLQ